MKPVSLKKPRTPAQLVMILRQYQIFDTSKKLIIAQYFNRVIESTYRHYFKDEKQLLKIKRDQKTSDPKLVLDPCSFNQISVVFNTHESPYPSKDGAWDALLEAGLAELMQEISLTPEFETWRLLYLQQKKNKLNTTATNVQHREKMRQDVDGVVQKDE